MLIAIPQSMKLQDWVQSVLFAMPGYSNISAMSNDDWQKWGLQFLSDPYLSTLHPPDPYAWDDWRLWGEHLVMALESAPDVPHFHP